MPEPTPCIPTFVSRLFLVLLLLAASTTISHSQNLVPNPGFEEYTTCPLFQLEVNFPFECQPWWAGPGSTDYFHGCSDFPVNVPINFQGFQYAHTGFGYLGGYYRTTNQNNHEFSRVRLIEPLQAGVCYKIGYWINLSNTSCGTNRVGALVKQTEGYPLIGETPQLDWGGEFFSDTVNWSWIWDYFTAVGGEEWLYIGNFYDDSETGFDPTCDNVPPYAYYYYDDVLIEEVPTVPFDLLLDAFGSGCDSFLIEVSTTPMLEDVRYEWSNGSNDQNIMVYESGEYTVTATYGCLEMEATIEVDIISIPPPDLGPDVTFCIGEPFTIELDPAMGDYEWNNGTSDPEITISEPGIYAVTLDDGCDLSSDTIEVFQLLPPEDFTLGPDTFLCPGDEFVISFDPSLGDFEWHDHSTESFYEIDNDGDYALTISNMCGEASDEMEVIDITPPSVELGPDTTSICEGSPLFVDLDPDEGTYTWQDGVINYSYIIGATGLYSVTVSNECGSADDFIYVEEFVPPSVDFGAPLEACSGDTIVLSAGNNTGNFVWQNGSTGPSFEVTATGTYSLTITNDCGTDVASIPIHFNPVLATPNLGADISLCPGDHVVLDANVPGANYIWNDLSTADSLVVNSSGTYYVQVSNFCSLSSDTIVVTVNNAPPSIQLPQDFALCDGENAILNAGIQNVTYSWSDGSQTDTLTVSAPGSYSLTVSNSCGSDIDTVIITDGGMPPSVALGVDTSICEGNTVVIIPASNNVLNWLWQDGSTNSSFVASTAGEIHVQATNDCGVSNDTMNIGLLPAIPSLSLGPDISMCPGESTLLTISIPDVSITWSDGSANPDLTITDSATVFATISNSCGSASDTAVVSLLPGAPTLELGHDVTICPGETMVLDPQVDDVQYEWQDGSNGTQYTISQQGLIALTISNSCGSATDSIHVTESLEGPQVNLGPDLVACLGEVLTIEAGISGVDYLWQDGTTGNEFIATASGVVILQVSNLCGTDADTLLVDISGQPPMPDLGEDPWGCEGVFVVLQPQIDSITTQVWQDGSKVKIYLADESGIYWVRQTNRCGEGVDSVEVTFFEDPAQFDLGPDTVLCPGDSFILYAPQTTHTLLWQDGSTDTSIIAKQAITYVLEISNQCGIQIDSLKVSYDVNVPQVKLDDFEWCEGDIIPLDATQVFEADYLWNTGEATPVIQVAEPGQYNVSVSTDCAETSDDANIEEIFDCIPKGEVYIPNTFSPNGDNVNEEFVLIPGEEVEILAIEGTIFDRWGNMIFYSTTNPFSWDGKFHNEVMQPGVYVFIIDVRYQVENVVQQKRLYGDVTLVR